MSNHEAKFVLSACRPNGADAGDPTMAEALVQARADPALNAWLLRHQAFDAAFAAKLREITPPSELRAGILAGVRAGVTTRSPRRAAWKRPVGLAIAAGLVLLLSVAAWWRLAPVGGATYGEFALNTVARGFLLTKRTPELVEIRQWLTEHRGPLPAALPPEFEKLRALGCRRLEFQGRAVSLVCFERDGKKYHLFVARREDFPAWPPGKISEFEKRSSLAAAAWSDALHHYVVVSHASVSELQPHLL